MLIGTGTIDGVRHQKVLKIRCKSSEIGRKALGMSSLHVAAAEMTYQFANMTLDLARGSLLGANGEIELRPKSFNVLRYLVANAGRVVSKDEMLQVIWPDVIVSEDSLTRCISDVRFAIGDRDAAIIKTIPKRGYRFEAIVTTSAAKASS
jgi:DNA-binding winged helix-turn-helix (wHTH) protein